MQGGQAMDVYVVLYFEEILYAGTDLEAAQRFERMIYVYKNGKLFDTISPK